MLNNPHIDIIVPTYNRQKDIDHFVEEILKQDYPNFTVFFIDDCSTPPLLLPIHSPHFKLIRLNKNEGQASARNYGIKSGKGDFIVSMDDDAWFFEDTNALFKIPSYFVDSTTGCVMFDVKTPNEDWLSVNRKLKDFQEIGSHITCGCAYKRKTIEDIKGFNGFLHSCAEETDISLRLFYNHYKIIFAKSIKVFHNYTPTIRSDQWFRQFCKNITRNDLIIVLSYYPKLFILPYFFGKFFSHLRYILFKNKRDRLMGGMYSVLGFFQVFINLNYVINNRQGLSYKVFKKWIKMRW
jgi:glycosyltransferase involved in cell wall biosynthesis